MIYWTPIMTLLPESLLQNKSHTHGAISQRSVVATLWFGWVWFKIEGTFTKKSPCDNIHGVNIETRVFSDEGWGGVTTSENHGRREVCRIVDLKSNVENGLKKVAMNDAAYKYIRITVHAYRLPLDAQFLEPCIFAQKCRWILKTHLYWTVTDPSWLQWESLHKMLQVRINLFSRVRRKCSTHQKDSGPGHHTCVLQPGDGDGDGGLMVTTLVCSNLLPSKVSIKMTRLV